MKKVLASIGIGNATVDTVLPSARVTQGESVEAEIHVTGGKVDQDVSRIDLELETRYRTEDGYAEGTVDRMRLTDGFTIEAGEERTLSTTIEIPYSTPVTLGNVDVWVETELEVTGVDPEDKDYLEVLPEPRLQAVFDALEGLGFSLRTAECSADPYGRYGGGRFVQEFEFRPGRGEFASALDELEVVPRPGADELTLYLEVDRRGGLFSELTDTDESKTSITVRETDPDALADRLRDTIAQYA